MSIDRWTKKMWCIYTIEYYSVIRDNETLPCVTTQMNSEGVMLSEISHMEKDRCHMMSCIWWNLKKQNKRKQKQTCRYREQTGGYLCGIRLGGG